MPQPVASAGYDAANELLQWNGQLFSYDLEGNLINDGVNSYSWDARNQLSQINTTTFQYDAGGRRIKNAAGTGFLYDDVDSVQELSGATPIANRITGGVDEFFSRADSSASTTPLTDALGSTIALVNSSGSIITQYTYDAFGFTTASGTASTNSFQYTGRENDGNGLYYYRARYYTPQLARFISEDPLRFDGGGANFYAYASDSPVNFIDPFGLEPCYTVLFVSVCYDPPGTSDVAKSAERAHEAQHRADFRNGNFLKLSCGEYEYRGFQKEVPIWKQRIDELKLARRYSRLADAQQKELNDDEEQYDVIKSHTAGSLQLTYPLCQEENEENDVIRNFPHNMNPHPPANGSPWRLPGMDPNL